MDFAYAGSLSKGGAASDVACATPCVSGSEVVTDIQLPGDVKVTGSFTTCAPGYSGCSLALGTKGSVEGAADGWLYARAPSGLRVRALDDATWASITAGAATIHGQASVAGGDLTVTGSVGVGTTSPNEKLVVDGPIRTLPRASATCNADHAGSIYFNSQDTTFYGCDGTAWKPLGGAQEVVSYKKSCTELFDSGELSSGLYTIDPDGGDPNNAFQVYCEMNVDGGGWTKLLQYSGGAFLGTAGAVGSGTSWMTSETSAGKLSDSQINAIDGTQFMVATSSTTYGGLRWGIFTPTSMFNWSSSSGAYNQIYNWASLKCWNGGSLDTSTPHSWSVCGDMGGPIGFCTHHSGIWAICLCATGVHENAHPCQTAAAGYSTYNFAVYKRTLPGAGNNTLRKSCKEILDLGESNGSGVYTIDPNGGSPVDGFQAYCDMTTSGGGWTKIMQYYGGTNLAVSGPVGSSGAWVGTETSAGKLSDNQINAIPGTQLMVSTKNTSYGGMQWGVFTPPSMFPWASASGAYNYIYNWSAVSCWNGANPTTATPHTWGVCGDMGGPVGFCTHHGGIWAICLCGTGVHENVHPCQSGVSGYSTGFFAVLKR